MVKIDIPKNLYKRVKTLVEESPEFDDINEFIKFVLEEVLKEEPEKEKKKRVYSKEEEEEVKERLKALGYL